MRVVCDVVYQTSWEYIYNTISVSVVGTASEYKTLHVEDWYISVFDYMLLPPVRNVILPRHAYTHDILHAHCDTVLAALPMLHYMHPASQQQSSCM